jgi:hypothetical protein
MQARLGKNVKKGQLSFIFLHHPSVFGHFVERNCTLLERNIESCFCYFFDKMAKKRPFSCHHVSPSFSGRFVEEKACKKMADV